MDPLASALLEARAAGDDAAVDAAAWALVQAHMGWIRTVHRRYMRRSSWPVTARDDYLQELIVSAHRALRRWDPACAAATTWISENAPNASRRTSSQVLGISQSEVDRLDAARKRGEDISASTPVSLDAPTHLEDGTVGDRVAIVDPDVAGEVTVAAQARALRDLVGSLPATLAGAEFVVRRFGLDGRPPESMRQIAARVGVTHQAVALAEQRAMDRLLHPATLRRIVRGLS